jgi:threonine aldolase
VIAAGGLFALRNNIARLADDHRRAAWLGEELGLEPGRTQSNIVVLAVADAAAAAAAAGEQGVLVSALGPQVLRLVTHLDVDDTGVERAAAVLGPLVRRD